MFAAWSFEETALQKYRKFGLGKEKRNKSHKIFVSDSCEICFPNTLIIHFLFSSTHFRAFTKASIQGETSSLLRSSG